MERTQIIRAASIIGLVLCVATNFSAHAQTSSGDSTEFSLALARSRAAANDLAVSVRAILGKQLASGGAVRAINVCADSAQMVGRRIQQQHGLSIRRVSQKWRNSQNAPDEFEVAELTKLSELHSTGKLTDATEVYRITEDDSVSTFRYLKPILVGEMCLNCHGSREKMKDLIYSAIRARYPNDKAVDFKTGDLRGAVSVKILLRDK